MIPSIQDCFSLMKKYEMLSNIKDHSCVVARIAKLIASNLVENGVDISIEKTVSGALLHDIAKTYCIKHRNDHSSLGRYICMIEDCSELAEIVGEHVILSNVTYNGSLKEKEIVYYSDKRVMHDSIVSIVERRDDLVVRYGEKFKNASEIIRENFEICRKIEQKIFVNLGFEPGNISNLVEDIIL